MSDKYKLYRPTEFKNLIDCFWELDLRETEPGGIEKTFAEVYHNLTFSIGENYERVSAVSKVISNAQVEPAHSVSNRFLHQKGNQIIGIRFNPLGIYPFIYTPLKKLINHSTDLKDILGHSMIELEDKLVELKTTTERFALLEQFLEKQFDYDRYKKTLELYPIMNQIRYSQHIPSIEVIARKNGTNYKTLNRKFNQVIGLGTKEFINIAKFRRALCHLSRVNQKESINYLNDYFDQAHYIKHFKQFSEITPGEYLKKLQNPLPSAEKICYNFHTF